MKGSPAFTRVMSDLTLEQMYDRATKESGVLINDLNEANNKIEEEEALKKQQGNKIVTEEVDKENFFKLGANGTH